jgi:hypothetical protein
MVLVKPAIVGKMARQNFQLHWRCGRAQGPIRLIGIGPQIGPQQLEADPLKVSGWTPEKFGGRTWI